MFDSAVAGVRGRVGRAQGRAQVEAERLDRFIEGRIEVVLNRLNIPSRSDIDRLNRSVDLLSKKVEALLAREAAQPRRPAAGTARPRLRAVESRPRRSA